MDDHKPEAGQLPTLSASDLTPSEAARMRAVLRTYFPAIDTDEDMSGGDAVERLNELCGALDDLGDFRVLETTAAE
jgi:hypothetical protein